MTLGGFQEIIPACSGRHAALNSCRFPKHRWAPAAVAGGRALCVVSSNCRDFGGMGCTVTQEVGGAAVIL